MKMPDRIAVIASRNWTDFHLQMPVVQGTAVGAVTLQTGTVIWITPKLAGKHFDVAEFLRHELSHAILDQNTTLYRSFKMKHQEWFYEGLAVSFGRQQAYLSRDEFVTRAKLEPLLPAFEGPSRDMRFNYPAWRYFLEFLKHTRGRHAFQDFTLAFMRDPDAWRQSFQKSFGTSFENAIAEFQSHVIAGDTP
jgi:hypothetical protein